MTSMIVDIQCQLCPEVISLTDPGTPNEVVDALYEHMMLSHGLTDRLTRKSVRIEVDGNIV